MCMHNFQGDVDNEIKVEGFELQPPSSKPSTKLLPKDCWVDFFETFYRWSWQYVAVLAQFSLQPGQWSCSHCAMISCFGRTAEQVYQITFSKGAKYWLACINCLAFQIKSSHRRIIINFVRTGLHPFLSYCSRHPALSRLHHGLRPCHLLPLISINPTSPIAVKAHLGKSTTARTAPLLLGQSLV